MVIRFTYELLDRYDRPLGALDGVTGGSVEVAALSRLGGSGSLSMDRTRDIDWLSHRVRITYTDGDVSWPCGIFLFSSPTEHHDSMTVSYDVGLLTKMAIIDQVALRDRYAVAAGSPVIPAVVGLIQSTGETRVAVTPSDATARADMTWKPGTSLLTVINDLLDSINYWTLRADSSGQFRVEPYVEPASRPISKSFEHGEHSIHLPEWSHEQDNAAVPNVVVLTSQGDEETEGLVGEAINANPDSKYSTVNRPELSYTEEGVEADSQATINALAQRKLLDLMSPVAKIGVSHAMVPLEPNQLVEFIPEDGERRLATIQRMSFDLRFDATISAEWRLVDV